MRSHCPDEVRFLRLSWELAPVDVTHMANLEEFKIGDTVQITGTSMTGNVGTVVHLDEKRQKYLVRIASGMQNYFTGDELKRFTSRFAVHPRPGSAGRSKCFHVPEAIRLLNSVSWPCAGR